MRPVRWHPPIELSSGERTIIKHIRRAKLFVFLREHRHEVFDEIFQAALDSSPLWGASRVEDTYNLLGHAFSISDEPVSFLLFARAREIRFLLWVEASQPKAARRARDQD